jgi:hypothetical protein
MFPAQVEFLIRKSQLFCVCLYCSTGEFGPGDLVSRFSFLDDWQDCRQAFYPRSATHTHTHRRKAYTQIPTQTWFRTHSPEVQAVGDIKLQDLHREATELGPFVYKLPSPKNIKHTPQFSKLSELENSAHFPANCVGFLIYVFIYLFIYVRAVSSAMMHVSLTRIRYNTTDE